MADPPSGDLSIGEIRRRLRRLPRERRREIISSIRAGRAVSDPRDALLAAAWADWLCRFARRMPWWLLPLERPRGRRAWLWIVHLVWIVGAIADAYVLAWSLLPGVWRWVLLALLAWSAITTPFAMRRMFSAYWNAPEAARRNRSIV